RRAFRLLEVRRPGIGRAARSNIGTAAGWTAALCVAAGGRKTGTAVAGPESHAPRSAAPESWDHCSARQSPPPADAPASLPIASVSAPRPPVHGNPKAPAGLPPADGRGFWEGPALLPPPIADSTGELPGES